MTDSPEQPIDAPPTAQHLTPRRAERVLHVVVPEDAHRSVRVAAAQSGLYFRDYIVRLLRTAKPIDVGTDTHNS